MAEMPRDEDMDVVDHADVAEQRQPGDLKRKQQPGIEYAKDGKKEKGVGRKKRIEILKKFTQEALKKHGPLIRSIVLFGSTARGTFRGESDIDIFVIVDDTRERITPLLRDQIEDDLDQIARGCSPQLSLQQPYMLTEFWRLVREGHPIIFNFIREGIPVYDKDIFLPIKRLLQMGEIRPSKEAVEKFIDRAPKRISRVENAKMYMIVEDLYYAMLESAQAVLMFLGKIPPRPSDSAEEVRRSLVKMQFLEESFAKDLEDIIELRKEVEHKRVKTISGAVLDEWIVKADAFVNKMQKVIVRIEILKRENMVEKSWAVMSETTLTLLDALKKPAPKAGPLAKAFEEHLVKGGVVSDKYLQVFEELEKMHLQVKAGKVLDLPKQDILVYREYVRKFIREAGRVLKKHSPQE
ncbi:MAG: nucleotidyltransferase domain-containing protein [Candidatus Aenigmarchaeota archaeon]|nr:nucleotidyltransferase domain-containing protein [Candidatus Aenigmarchaeota archaeon]